jgi:hypothetical protein
VVKPVLRLLTKLGFPQTGRIAVEKLDPIRFERGLDRCHLLTAVLGSPCAPSIRLTVLMLTDSLPRKVAFSPAQQGASGPDLRP